MALNAANLASAMETGIRSAVAVPDGDYPKLTAYCQALATAIVDHIKNNAEIDNGQAASSTTNSALDGLNAHTHNVATVAVTGGIK